MIQEVISLVPLPAGREVCTVEETAISLGVSDEAVRRLIAKGFLRQVPYFSKPVRVSRKSLENFIDGGHAEKTLTELTE
ncbi:hypothetical protein DB347_17645 [Opitutaceae bacterium EW11]|nr:hypothetical protein DB347_17645 [Opitutaceae bacterium EW11]